MNDGQRQDRERTSTPTQVIEKSDMVSKFPRPQIQTKERLPGSAMNKKAMNRIAMILSAVVFTVTVTPVAERPFPEILLLHLFQSYGSPGDGIKSNIS